MYCQNRIPYVHLMMIFLNSMSADNLDLSRVQHSVWTREGGTGKPATPTPRVSLFHHPPNYKGKNWDTTGCDTAF